MDERSVSFGAWVRRRRKLLDFTQDELAQRVGYSPGAIRKIESDERRPSRELAARLADVLAVPLEEHLLFLKVARAELGVDHLEAPGTINEQPGIGGGRATVPTPDQFGDASGSESMPAFPTNLPRQPTPLIGREQEIATAVGLLRQPEMRILTLTGPGGTGKTRLALAAAIQVLHQFTDGVVFIDLAPIRDPALILTLIATTLRLRETREQPLDESLRAYLAGKRQLLLLDNFEQVVAGAPLLDNLLRAAPDLCLLVTSRIVLGLYGEHVITVPPLQLPDPQHLRAVAQVAQVEAVRLFAERARAANTAFVLNETNVQAVVDICHRLDGLPLAIELAAARTRVLSPPALLQRLEQRLPMLTGGARNLPARQQTLLNTLQWSYDLLAPDEQRLFRHLAVFTGGCNLDAAEAVCRSSDTSGDVLVGVQALVEHSLLRSVEATGGEPRLVMLETIREYGLGQAVAHTELDILHKRHADYYLGMAETAARELRGKDQLRWLRLLEREHDNLRTALDWYVERRVLELAVRLGAALVWFWYLQGHRQEGRERLFQLLTAIGLDMARVEEAHLPRSRFVAEVLFGAGLCFDSDPFLPNTEALSLFAASAALFCELGDTRGQAIALGFRALTPAHVDPEIWPARLTEVIQLLQSSGDGWAMALAYVMQSYLAEFQGDLPLAAVYAREAVGLFRDSGDRWGIAFGLQRSAELAAEQGDSVREIQAYKASLLPLQELGDKPALADALRRLADALRWDRDYERAASVYAECIALFRDLGFPLGLAPALHGQGYVALWQGRSAVARQLFVESLGLFRSLQHHNGIGWCLQGLAGVAGAHGPRGAARAARLLGAADVLVVPVVHWPARPRAEYERVVASARVHLETEEWDATWAEGQAMMLEQAVAYALDNNELPDG